MLTSAQYDTAKYMWSYGASVKCIAGHLGVKPSTVMSYVSRYRFDFPERFKCPRLTPDERKSIVAMRANGMKIREIADAIGCHKNTVYNVLRAAREGRI